MTNASLQQPTFPAATRSIAGYQLDDGFYIALASDPGRPARPLEDALGAALAREWPGWNWKLRLLAVADAEATALCRLSADNDEVLRLVRMDTERQPLTVQSYHRDERPVPWIGPFTGEAGETLAGAAAATAGRYHAALAALDREALAACAAPATATVALDAARAFARARRDWPAPRVGHDVALLTSERQVLLIQTYQDPRSAAGGGDVVLDIRGADGRWLVHHAIRPAALASPLREGDASP